MCFTDEDLTLTFTAIRDGVTINVTNARIDFRRGTQLTRTAIDDSVQTHEGFADGSGEQDDRFSFVH